MKSRNVSSSDDASTKQEEVPAIDLNPLTAEFKLPWHKLPQVIVMSVSIAPLRLISLTILEVMCWLLASVALIGIDNEQLREAPIKGWRKQLKEMVCWLGRLGMFIQGFTFIEVNGKPARGDQASIIVCAPHRTFFDGNVFFTLNECPTVTANSESSNMPIFGKLLKLTQPVLIDREAGRAGNTAVVDELRRRANPDGKWPQYIVFPEGTTTNGKALLRFKTGAFLPGRPVQPVTLQYTDKWDTYSWTWQGGAPGNGLRIDFLPVYQPSADELADPQLFADNVRQLMSQSLKIPCSDLTLSHAMQMAQEQRQTKVKLSSKL